MSRYVFGPAPSRRLGRSLGVDPIPLKTCNWNCVYCQLGRTSPLQPSRDEYVDADEVMAELHSYLAEHGEDDFDWITFVGSGEPTLHRRLGWMIHEAKALTKKPVAVITNGALLRDPEVRAELLEADAVMPTISAGTERTYLRLHRPAHGLDFRGFVEGLVAFREAYRGKLWAEVMLVAAFNDDEPELTALGDVLRRVRPDEIQIVIPTRPPALATVHPAGPEQVALAIRVLSTVAPVSAPSEGPKVTVVGSDLQDVLVGLVQRHPMTEEELARALDRWTADEVRDALAALTESKRVLWIERCGRRFFSSAESRYVDGSDRG